MHGTLFQPEGGLGGPENEMGGEKGSTCCSQQQEEREAADTFEAGPRARGEGTWGENGVRKERWFEGEGEQSIAGRKRGKEEAETAERERDKEDLPQRRRQGTGKPEEVGERFGEGDYATKQTFKARGEERGTQTGRAREPPDSD